MFDLKATFFPSILSMQGQRRVRSLNGFMDTMRNKIKLLHDLISGVLFVQDNG